MTGQLRPHELIPARLPCRDCGVDTGGAGIGERYMVHFHLWDDVGAGAGFLCIGCLEARLGRQLNGWDFLPCPLNSLPDYFRSPRLQSRLRDYQLRDDLTLTNR